VTKLDSYKKSPLGTITAGADPVRLTKTTGMLPRNKLALRFSRGAFDISSSRVAGPALAAMEAALGHDHGGNGVLEDELFLIIGFQDH
jgi:hypothetical protein